VWAIEGCGRSVSADLRLRVAWSCHLPRRVCFVRCLPRPAASGSSRIAA
jgi:hypothetical protein